MVAPRLECTNQGPLLSFTTPLASLADDNDGPVAVRHQNSALDH